MDGALIGVPDRAGFDKDALKGLKLVQLSCDTALGFIFVALRDDLAPLAERLGDLGDLISNFGLADYEDRHVVHEEVWDGNWKLLIENFIESYHTTYTHTGSIGPTNPTQLAEFGPWGAPGFAIHSNSYRDEDLPAIYNAKLTTDEQRRFYVISLFPNGLAAGFCRKFCWSLSADIGRT
jgi:choline monooxygenase